MSATVNSCRLESFRGSDHLSSEQGEIVAKPFGSKREQTHLENEKKKSDDLPNAEGKILRELFHKYGVLDIRSRQHSSAKDNVIGSVNIKELCSGQSAMMWQNIYQ